MRQRLLAMLAVYRQIWLVDTEFHARPGYRVRGICICAIELRSGDRVSRWVWDRDPGPCPWDAGDPSVLIVCFSAVAECSFFLACGWELPRSLFDLWIAYRLVSNGRVISSRLLAALKAEGIPHSVDDAEKRGWRQLCIEGGPFAANHPAGLQAYCMTDTESLEALLDMVLPRVDLGQVLELSRYSAHIARVEYRGIPVDVARLPDERDPKLAFAQLQRERESVRSGEQAEAGVTALTTMPTFKSFALSLFKAKVGDGSIASAKGREKWMTILSHLSRASFAGYLVDRIDTRDVMAWRHSLATLRWKRTRKNPETGEIEVTKTGAYAASTLNDRLAVARVIFAEMRVTFELPRDAMTGVKDYDTKAHRTYTALEPNSLTPEETGRWLRKFKELYPQHYALVFLGLALGQRPSTLRPLRRQGDDPDLDLEVRTLHIRRSHTLRQEIMAGTKTFVDQMVTLPPDLVDVLRWHIRTQLKTWQQRKSELLFPTEDGKLRSKSSLQKPFETVTKACGLTKKITPRAMRRTFQDLTRAAAVDGIVAKAICGHSDAMRTHYSTAGASEVEQGIAKVISLATRREVRPKKKAARA